MLRRIPGLRPPRYRHLAGGAEARFDVVRNHLRFYGPARIRDVATFLDSPVKEVKAHWPDDAVEVVVSDLPPAPRPEPRFVLAGDLDALTGGGPGGRARTVRLLGPHDPYLQLRDRELLVADEARQKHLWRMLGRPAGSPPTASSSGPGDPGPRGRSSRYGSSLWEALSARDRALVEEEAERLAAHRGDVLTGIVEE